MIDIRQDMRVDRGLKDEAILAADRTYGKD